MLSDHPRLPPGARPLSSSKEGEARRLTRYWLPIKVCSVRGGERERRREGGGDGVGGGEVVRMGRGGWGGGRRTNGRWEGRKIIEKNVRKGTKCYAYIYQMLSNERMEEGVYVIRKGGK